MDLFLSWSCSAPTGKNNNFVEVMPFVSPSARFIMSPHNSEKARLSSGFPSLGAILVIYKRLKPVLGRKKKKKKKLCVFENGSMSPNHGALSTRVTRYTQWGRRHFYGTLVPLWRHSGDLLYLMIQADALKKQEEKEVVTVQPVARQLRDKSRRKQARQSFHERNTAAFTFQMCHCNFLFFFFLLGIHDYLFFFLYQAWWFWHRQCLDLV